MFLLSVIALAIVLVVVMVSGCGTESKKASEPPPPPPADTAWTGEIKPLVERHCGGCHNGTTHPLKFDTGAKFKGSKARVRISNGTMPPNGALPDDVKAKLLAYLG
jgi:hypothetical protein